MAALKNTLKTILFALVFLGGGGYNLLFANRLESSHPHAVLSLQVKPAQAFLFFFQPVEDNENDEWNAELAAVPNSLSPCLLSNAALAVSKPLGDPFLPERHLWRVFGSFRL